ncbi:pyrophosphohydrolase domain-containing protein [Paenibacillus caseinilyticus]|uniref:Phosphoribosyl-ATP pyrophosphohydrolase n=1 Tax=Paenibacillus mucilaginosus K02 TaxID=997761 RepID=I0BIV0_9BACL|nr:nucleoside triphosphate pyrophosphohydrolase [Paenibacillus mucilaginosus]AFH62297.1 phosphoribosyl-ATP pyrophosphohydrolase [Paenibacillus mucilaginosus K02]
MRDKIPQIIEFSGKKCIVRVLGDIEYYSALKTKMQEELNEFLEATDQRERLEELADLLEVMYSFAPNKCIEWEETDRVRLKKSDERGAFSNKIMLCEVSD